LASAWLSGTSAENSSDLSWQPITSLAVGHLLFDAFASIAGPVHTNEAYIASVEAAYRRGWSLWRRDLMST
jgi:hypothetical protein